MSEVTAAFGIGDLRSAADAHGFNDWSDDDLRSMMGLVGEAVVVVGGVAGVADVTRASNDVAPETMRVRLADLERLVAHVGAKKSVA